MLQSTLECVGWIVSNLSGEKSTWFWTMAQALFVGFGLLFIYLQMRAQRVANMLACLSGMDKKWDSPEYSSARRDVCKQYLADDTNIETHGCLKLLHFFEELGIYAKKGVFDVDVLWSLFNERIVFYWNILEEKIQAYRQRENDKTFYEDFANLKMEMDRHSEKRGQNSDEKTRTQRKEFAKRELERIPEDRGS